MSASDDRLTMLDDFGARKALIPAEVDGLYRRRRDKVYTGLILFFLILPWITFEGRQALWLDVPNRRFEILWTEFRAHDVPLLFFVLAAGAMTLALVTSVWGRVWCGWACPQTVFIEGVYRRIERWIEGGYIERRRLRTAPWSGRKFRLWAIKWTLYFVVSSLFAHSFIAYFAGSARLIEMIQGPPEDNWTYFLLVSLGTLLLMFDFGWFREQFCIIMCPYGRFQGVLMDAQTTTVLYDESRGEPRKGSESAKAEGRQGDCVACNRCVQVCPTGIDIRNGNQLECIACTACIDACDEIMTKVKRPIGLIAYGSLVKSTTFYRRPRSALYAALSGLAILGLFYNVLTHASYSLAVLRAKDTPYQELADGVVMNHFKAHLINQSRARQEFEISLPEAARAAGLQIKMATATVPLEAGQAVDAHFFLLIPKANFNPRGESRARILVRERTTGGTNEVPVTAVGPNGH